MTITTKVLTPFGILLEATHPNADVHQLDIKTMRELLNQHQLLILRGFRTLQTADQFSNYCALWGEISVWPFGKVLELIEQKKPEDHIFDHNYVPLHWDGMYRPQVPEYQIFHCVSAPLQDQGGRTTFSNTALALQRATQDDLALWSRVTGIYSRKMEFYQSKTVAPIITKHPVRNFPVIRFCEPPQENDDTFINHPQIEFQGLVNNEVEYFQRSLFKALYAPENFYAHPWQTGDIVISDNHTLLHGREAFTSGAPRHLRRVHILGKPPLTNPHLVFHQ